MYSVIFHFLGFEGFHVQSELRQKAVRFHLCMIHLAIMYIYVQYAHTELHTHAQSHALNTYSTTAAHTKHKFSTHI